MPLITPAQLKKVTTTLTTDRCNVLAPLISDTCTKYGISETLPFQMFLANILQESGECSQKKENMNYSAQGLANTFPGRYSKTRKPPYVPNDLALSLARKPVAIANATYGGRMGNYLPNDGWDFKGGGYIGLTGRTTYTSYGKYIGKTPEDAATFVQGSDAGALDSACWFFAINRKLIALAKTGTFKQVCSVINTGSKDKQPIGYDVRLKYFQKIQQVIG